MGNRILSGAGIVGVGIVVLLGGLYATGMLGLPSAGVEDNSWGNVTDERIEVLTTVWIDNPNPGITGDGATADYALEMNGIRLADGNKSNISVPSGYHTTTIQTNIFYQQLPNWWVSHVENDEVSELSVETNINADVGPLSASPTVSRETEIETEIEQMIRQSLAEQEGVHSGPGVEIGNSDVTETVGPRIVVEDTDAYFASVTDEQTHLHAEVTIHNPNEYPLPTPAFTGDIQLNQIHVATWDVHDVELLNGTADTTIPPKTSRELTFGIVLQNEDIADWFGTHIDRDEHTDIETTTQLAVAINGNTMTIPTGDNGLQCRGEMTTGILVDQRSGISSNGCVLTTREIPVADLRQSGAAIDLTETEWWDELSQQVTDPIDDIPDQDTTPIDETDRSDQDSTLPDADDRSDQDLLPPDEDDVPDRDTTLPDRDDTVDQDTGF